MEPWRAYEGRRTEAAHDIDDGEAVRQLIAALPDLKDFGTAWVTKAGAVTIPANARAELGLSPLQHLHVLGSPSLGIAIVVGTRRNAADTLAFLLDVPPTAASAGAADEPSSG